MNTIIFHCYDLVQGLNSLGEPTLRREYFEVRGELLPTGQVVVRNHDREDEVFDTPNDFEPTGAAICDGWVVEE